ncbi:response regulator transcription factor [Sulfurimonas sp.]|uniref:response regulator transcription factor n=1 Tax=Sulfurimonas sp. TaxID=2022749 RepID=UPI00286DCA6F|nr:LuxR C-terminal-related transcriptional regulator [Sulfurimonas sp.]
MKTIFFSSNISIIDEWKKKHNVENSITCHDLISLKSEIKNSKHSIVIADYNTVSSDVNSLISSGSIPSKLIVLEKEPSIVTGKMLILRGVKAYGNSRMLNNHFMQMIQTVADENIWTYPELTAFLAKTVKKISLNENSKKLIEDRLSEKEKEVLYLILDGFINDAIASALNITTRTVKAHVSSIFNKLHVNDRVSLILLLK